MNQQVMRSEKDFVFNIVPITQDEVISKNRNIEIKQESQDQVRINTLPNIRFIYF